MQISLIVPIYHGEKFISSIIDMVEKNIENLIDDSSKFELIFINDDPATALPDYTSDLLNVCVVNTDINRGIHGARVYGLQHSTGDYVLFLDQDDIIFDNFFQSQLSQIGNADAVVCQARHENKQFYNNDLPFERVISKEYMLNNGNSIVSPGQVLIKRSAISNIWMENIQAVNGADDFLLWMSMLGEGKRFALNHEILFEHTVDGSNTSWNTTKMLASEHEAISILCKSGFFSGVEINMLTKLEMKLKIKHIEILDKFKKMYFTLDKMMELKQKGLSINLFLSNQGIKSVAIYGAGYIGKRLAAELPDMLFYIDRNAEYIDSEEDIYLLENAPTNVDAIVISMVQGTDKIKNLVKTKYPKAKVWTINELLSEMEK